MATSSQGLAAKPGLGARDGSGTGKKGLPAGAIWIAIAAVCAMVAVPVAQVGSKWVFAACGAVVFAVGLLLVRERARFVLVVSVVTLQFLLFKTLGPMDYKDIGGAGGIYVTSLDFWLLILYGMWFLEGRMLYDLGRAFQSQKILVALPILAGFPALLSLLAATNQTLAMAELFRMGWMYLLFVYIALRVETRRDLVFVIGSIFIIGLVQSVLAFLEWRHHGSLGLTIIGEESDLQVRALVDGANAVPRPSGTVQHPDFLAALVSPIALVAYSLAINLQRRAYKLLCLLAAGVAVVPLVVSQTRAALLGMGVAFVLLTGSYLIRRRLQWKWVIWSGALALLVGLIMFPQIYGWLANNLQYDRFSYEVQSRVELNWVALTMAASSPIIGIGINNFQYVFSQFDPYGVILAGRPVHNLFLLVLAETGGLGLLGLLAFGAALLTMAVRLGRSEDRLLGGLGAGMAAAYVFFAVEEVLTFSLRHDMPLALFWLLSGLLVAGCRMAAAQRREVEANAA